MPPGALHDLSPFRRRPLTIPPNSLNAWLRLAVWETWIGMLFCAVFAGGIALVAAAPGQVVAVADLSRCYADPPVPSPCERTLHRGALNVAFSAFCGFMLLAGAAGLLWEAWDAVEPKPITDDFLKLLDDSFGRDWRNPVSWPWARVLWAYGFTVIVASVTAGIGFWLWTSIASSNAAGAPAVRVETSQSFRVDR